MAQLISSIAGFTGSLGNLSAYRMKGSDKIILRTKGGASRKRLKTGPEFVNTRRTNAEFGARAKASSYVMGCMRIVKRLADHNIAGPLNSLTRPIQLMDAVNGWGERDILFSKRPKLLEGFNLNKENPFDSILRSPVTYTISKENFSAHVDIPKLIPRINLFVPAPVKQPYYNIVIAYGIVPDIYYKDKQYVSTGEFCSAVAQTEWYPVAKGSPVVSLDIKLKVPGITNESATSYSHMLTIGIEFGIPVGGNDIETAPYVGAAKIMAMV